MITSFHGKNLITLQDWSKQEIETVLDVSYDLKRKFAQGIRTPYLQDQTVFLMFFNTSTRTRNSMKPASHSSADMPIIWIPMECRSAMANPPRIPPSSFPAMATVSLAAAASGM